VYRHWVFQVLYIIYHHYIGGGQDADADAQAMGFTDAADPRCAHPASTRPEWA
jgi:hypothetical protein